MGPAGQGPVDSPPLVSWERRRRGKAVARVTAQPGKELRGQGDRQVAAMEASVRDLGRLINLGQKFEELWDRAVFRPQKAHP